MEDAIIENYLASELMNNPEFPKKLNRKKISTNNGRSSSSCSKRIRANHFSSLPNMFLLTSLVLAVQLIYSVNCLCVWQQGDGVRVACGFRQSGLFRLRNFGGVKSWAGLGFSVGDEDGLKESMTNVEKSESESRSFRPPASLPLINHLKPYILNEDENSDEIPEDTDRRRRRNNFDNDTPQPTSNSKSEITSNASFEKRKLESSSPTNFANVVVSELAAAMKNGSSSSGNNGTSADTKKKMTVSVNIPAFEPMPFEFELSSVKVSSAEKDTVDKYISNNANKKRGSGYENQQPQHETSTPPKTNEAPPPPLYKKPISNNGQQKRKKKPFRIQLLENTEQIADEYKTKNGIKSESTLLLPSKSLSNRFNGQQQERSLSEALLQQHTNINTKDEVKFESGRRFDNFTSDMGDEDFVEEVNPNRVLRRPVNSAHKFSTQRKPTPNARFSSKKDADKHAQSFQRNSNAIRNNPPRRDFHPREKSNRRPLPPPPPPPPSKFPRKKPPPFPKAESRKFPSIPTIKIESFKKGPPPPPQGPPSNSVRLPLSVLKKYLPKSLSWGGRRNMPPHRRPHHHHKHPPTKHSHEMKSSRHPGPGGPRPTKNSNADTHLAGSINRPHHRPRFPLNHHQQGRPMKPNWNPPPRINPSVPPKHPHNQRVPGPVPSDPKRPGPSVRPGNSGPHHHRYYPSPSPSGSPPFNRNYSPSQRRPGPNSRERFPQSSSSPFIGSKPISTISPSSMFVQHDHEEKPAHEKETILHALKTLSQAKADIIKSIVKEGNLPQGVVKVVPSNATSSGATIKFYNHTKPGVSYSSSEWREQLNASPLPPIPTSLYGQQHPPQFVSSTVGPPLPYSPSPSPTYPPIPSSTYQPIHSTYQPSTYQPIPSTYQPMRHEYVSTTPSTVFNSHYPTATLTPPDNYYHYHHHPSEEEHFEPSEELSEQHEQYGPPDEGFEEEEEEDSETQYTEKLNSISTKLSELPDNEEYITLPIDDVLSMLLSTSKHRASSASAERSKEYLSNYFGTKNLNSQEAEELDEKLRLSTRQTELGKILYDMGIIHRIAAGNLTVAQMVIVNKLIDLNQNEKKLIGEDEDGDEDDYGSGDDYEEENMKKAPAKYILPSSVNGGQSDSGHSSKSQELGRSKTYDYDPRRPVQTYTMPTTTSTTTARPYVKPGYGIIPGQSYTTNYNPYSTYSKPDTFYKSSSGGSAVDDKVLAALQEYRIKQGHKANLLYRRNGDENEEESIEEYDEPRRLEVEESEEEVVEELPKPTRYIINPREGSRRRSGIEETRRRRPGLDSQNENHESVPERRKAEFINQRTDFAQRSGAPMDARPPTRYINKNVQARSEAESEESGVVIIRQNMNRKRDPSPASSPVLVDLDSIM